MPPTQARHAACTVWGGSLPSPPGLVAELVESGREESRGSRGVPEVPGLSASSSLDPTLPASERTGENGSIMVGGDCLLRASSSSYEKGDERGCAMGWAAPAGGPGLIRMDAEPRLSG